MGQPAATWGRVTGLKWGVVNDWGTYGVPAGPAADDCSGSGTNFTGPRVNIVVIGGDSGGPITLQYNGFNYLAALISSNTSSNTFGSWVGYLGVPTGSHICTHLAQCG